MQEIKIEFTGKTYYIAEIDFPIKSSPVTFPLITSMDTVIFDKPEYLDYFPEVNKIIVSIDFLNDHIPGKIYPYVNHVVFNMRNKHGPIRQFYFNKYMENLLQYFPNVVTLEYESFFVLFDFLMTSIGNIDFFQYFKIEEVIFGENVYTDTASLFFEYLLHLPRLKMISSRGRFGAEKINMYSFNNNIFTLSKHFMTRETLYLLNEKNMLSINEINITTHNYFQSRSYLGKLDATKYFIEKYPNIKKIKYETYTTLFDASKNGVLQIDNVIFLENIDITKFDKIIINPRGLNNKK